MYRMVAMGPTARATDRQGNGPGPDPARGAPPAAPAGGARGRAARILLASAIVIVSINVWTGGPVATLWIAARVESGMFPTLSYIGLVAVVLAAISFVLLRILALLGRTYETSLGRQQRVRQHVPWLRSMRGERRTYSGDERPVSAVDRVMIAAVTVCVIAFEVWFFAFAHQTLIGGGAR